MLEERAVARKFLTPFSMHYILGQHAEGTTVDRQQYKMDRAYLLLNNFPVLVQTIAKDRPHFSSYFLVCLSQVFKAGTVEVLGPLGDHDPVVPLAACIICFAQKVRAGDPLPVMALPFRFYESGIVLDTPTWGSSSSRGPRGRHGDYVWDCCID